MLNTIKEVYSWLYVYLNGFFVGVAKIYWGEPFWLCVCEGCSWSHEECCKLDQQ